MDYPEIYEQENQISETGETGGDSQKGMTMGTFRGGNTTKTEVYADKTQHKQCGVWESIKGSPRRWY